MPTEKNRKGAWEIARHVWSTGEHELGRMETYLSPELFSQCVSEIAECTGRILTSGAGTSAAAARKIAHSLCCIERPALFLDPSDAVHGGLGVVQPGDMAILISKGGGTREMVQLLPAFASKGVPVVAVTENPDSALAKAAHIVVPIHIEREADEFNMLATTSTMAVVAYFDAVCIALMSYTNYTREQFAVIHPSGAVGDRLLGKKEGHNG